jgi:hypothetical protein
VSLRNRLTKSLRRMADRVSPNPSRARDVQIHHFPMPKTMAELAPTIGDTFEHLAEAGAAEQRTLAHRAACRAFRCGDVGALTGLMSAMLKGAPWIEQITTGGPNEPRH